MSAQMDGSSDSREALLDAVEATLRKDGLAKLSLRAVARTAGFSHGAPGALFGDRAGMLSAYAARGYSRLAAALRDAVEGMTEPAEMLTGIGTAYIRFALREPECFVLMFRDDLLCLDRPELVEARESAWEPLSAALDTAVARGIIAAERASLVQLGAWSLVHGFSQLWLSGAFGRRSDPNDAGELESLAGALPRLFAHSVLGEASTTNVGTQVKFGSTAGR